MKNITHPRHAYLSAALIVATLLTGTLLLLLNSNPPVVNADPIPPEEGGYPKFNTSIKTVTPTLAHTGGETLRYLIEIRNTGAYTAADTTLTDAIPDGTSYNDDAQASVPSTFTEEEDKLTWEGDVGFDESVVISFSLTVDDNFSGVVRNSAVISHPRIAEPVTRTAETAVTDEPILVIDKTSAPAQPGAEKPLTYTLTVANQGQPAHDLSLTVTDQVPDDTTVRDVGADGDTDGDTVTWTRSVTLDLGETTKFTFSVDVNDVPSGTVITNDDYQVDSPATSVAAGEPYTVTIVDPIFRLSKHVWPDPPGSNREMTYTLELLNKGSLATDLVITDRVPAGVEYRRGGSETDGLVSWTLDELDTGESAAFTFTVYVSDVLNVPIVNDDYAVCAQGEDVCQTGEVLTSVVRGPHFAASAELDPFVHQPGGGQSRVTPTLKVRNLGPGNALDAQALLYFDNINVRNIDDVDVIPDKGSLSEGPDCGDTCKAFVWVGDLNVQEIVTFTTTYDPMWGHRGRNTEGSHPFTTTIVITDSLDNGTTDPISATAEGFATESADLVVSKSAPPVIGRGQLMTYHVRVRNNALSTDDNPWLTDTVPFSTSLVSISDGGVSQTVDSSTVISWTLPEMDPADEVRRSFSVRVDGDLVSGTRIVNQDYSVYWTESETETLSHTGDPVTTTVKEVGLIDSYKEVTPTLTPPGPGNVLTYFLHIVNSGPLTATDVSVYDYLPWESSTYQRDAVASAGEVISDIISLEWTGEVGAFSSEIVTFTILVDEDYQGPITNTATITHPDLLSEVEVQAVAYVTEKPVLEIAKQASRDEVEDGNVLEYTIRVNNRGQQATDLVITDTLPQNTTYIPDSGGKLVDGELRWSAAVLEPGGSCEFGFAVTVTQQSNWEVANERYGVSCEEGVVATGEPVVTKISGGGQIYLPLVLKQYN